MKIAVVGAGFTGLTAAYKLVQHGHRVTVFEKASHAGGLAAVYKRKEWEYPLEKHYHHWFTNDTYALNLIRELGFGKDILVLNTVTSVYVNNRKFPMNSPADLITFSPLSVPERIRMGVALLYLKLIPPQIAIRLEKYTAHEWMMKYMGKKGFSILWQPLLEGKFSMFARKVNMAWFWGRIKKRTMKLAYLKGGYGRIITALEKEIRKMGGEFQYNTGFEKRFVPRFDKIIVTTPSIVFASMFDNLPKGYTDKLRTIPHLHAYNLLLISKKKFLDSEYWLNINDREYPFIGVIEHTNMIEKIHYGGRHLIWIANYLPPEHPFLKMNKRDLLKKFIPYLRKINPDYDFDSDLENYELFFGHFAQPVFYSNYSRFRPQFTTPIPNVYLANMDMVYPWDRGTNYAIELGLEVAKIVNVSQ